MTSAVPADDAPAGIPAGQARTSVWVRRPWVSPLVVGVGALAACIGLAVLQPADRGPVLCPFRALTGLDCPGCGMTRATARLAGGRVPSAADYNLLLVLALPMLGYLYLRWLAGSVGIALPAPRAGRVTRGVLLAAVVAFAVLRNLPVGIGRYLNSDPSLR